MTIIRVNKLQTKPIL